MRSSPCISHRSRPPYAVAKLAAELLRSTQVDLRTEHRGKLGLHGGQPNETRLAARLELDQQIDVAVRPSGAHQSGAEQGQAEDVPLPAELPQLRFSDLQAGHGSLRSRAAACENAELEASSGHRHRPDSRRCPAGFTRMMISTSRSRRVIKRSSRSEENRFNL